MIEILDDLFLERKDGLYRKRRISRIFVIILVVGMGISTLIAWSEVETIIGSGPIMSLLGIIFYFVVRKLKNRLSLVVAFIPLIVSTIWFSIIWTYHLEPSDCDVIVPTSLSIISILYLVIGINLFRAFSSGM